MLRRELEPGSRPIAAAIIAWTIAAIALALPHLSGMASDPFEVKASPTPRPETDPIRAIAEGGPRRPRARARKKAHTRRPREARTHKPRAAELGHNLPVKRRFLSERVLSRPHHDYPAIDIAIPRWRNVYSVADGRVKAVTRWGACGKGVIVKARDGHTYTYCHGSKLSVRRGRIVGAGTRLMLSGNTGNSSAPHLHLQITDPRGHLVCPQDVLPAWERGIPRSPHRAHRHGCISGRGRHERGAGKRRR